jgi:hypothetical protein
MPILFVCLIEQQYKDCLFVGPIDGNATKVDENVAKPSGRPTFSPTVDGTPAEPATPSSVSTTSATVMTHPVNLPTENSMLNFNLLCFVYF